MPEFATTGSLAAARGFHTATLLPNGKVLIAGGQDTISGNLSSAELYDPATGAVPGVTAPTSAGITETTATLGGTIASDGGSAISERGVVFAETTTNPNPQIGGSGATRAPDTSAGTIGVLTVNVSGLTPGTAYSFRAYATSGSGTGYSATGSFITPITYTVTPTAGTNGKISPNTVQVVNSGGSASFTATPDSGYMIMEWRINGRVEQTGGPSYTVGNVTANTTVQVSFIPLSNNADLASLAPSVGALTPAFASNTVNYTANVANSTTTMTVTSTVAVSTATVTVNGVPVASGTASAALSLAVGDNPITTVITAQDGVTTKIYSLIVTRAGSSNANLLSLACSAGAFSPPFSTGTTSYTKSVPNATTSVTVTPVVADSTATVKVNGIAVASGLASGGINLPVGPNVVSTVVTAQDGVTTKTYAVTVTRAPSTIAILASLTPSAGTLSPAFASGTTSYTESVPNATTSLRVTPVVTDSTATVKVNGVSVASGAPSALLALSVGMNTITIVVTAQDGIATTTYNFIVTRNLPDAKVPSMAVLKPASAATVSGAAGSAIPATGWASDGAGVAQVLVSLNGGSFTAATLTPLARPVGRVNWSLPVTPENGMNKLVAKALDTSGNESAVKTVYFRYAITRPEVAGLYTGLATPTVDSTNPARQVGLSKVTVGRTGAFTGWLRLGGPSAPLTLSATFGNGGDARFWVNKAPTSTLEIKRTGLPSLFLALNLDVSAPLTQQITGTLTENGIVVSTLTLNRQLYTAAKIPAGSPLMHVPATLLNPLTDKGAYTCIFQAIAPPNEGLPAPRYPQGDGWALARVKTSGAVTFAGRLADGQPFSYANYLSKDNVLPFYLRPYAAAGTVSGPVSFRDVLGQSDVDGVGLHWFKPANAKGKLYPIGWPAGIKVDVLGSKFIVPAKPTRTNPTPFYLSGRDNILGLPGAPTPTGVTLMLADGGTPGIPKAATVDARNKVAIALPADPLLNLKAAFPTDITGRLTGRLTGSFKHSGNNKMVTFGGVVFQKLHTASGYFLYYPPKPPGQPAPSGLSGSVGIAP